MRKGRCPACLLILFLQCHHIFPKRWFGDNPPFKYLCADCHAQLERLITAEETRFSEQRVKLPRQAYSEMLDVFIEWKNAQVQSRQEYFAHRTIKVAVRGDRATRRELSARHRSKAQRRRAG
jgi:hypothetical protein